ncbi:general stress protein 26 [Lipingzhangella halophila]|uniref:General stress protein 26 n=1 Tax=Lipingzhangella halophila TaxID=1783352 RepID=A0A7W7RIU0_9ACTN|nr:pyridoxamine 5'-phosphate oxidase family protein [Lipingzhangella halophila]MBB4932784.1 general stress protein 26 [Lipingzhangella halophila]
MSTALHPRLPYSEISDEFTDIVSAIMYATMTTVDLRGRPRSRILVPIWQTVDDLPVGWLATFKTPVKRSHLAGNPHATLSYWSPRQDFAAADTVTRWVEDAETKREVWELYRTGSPPGVGYDPETYWPGGPENPKFHVLRMDPFRVQVLRGRDLLTGRPARIWRDPAS